MNISYRLHLPALREFIDDFLLVLERDGKSGRTVTNYKQPLVMFWRWLVANNLPVDITAITEEQLSQYIVARRRDGITNASLRTHLTAFRVFFKWLVEQGYIDVSPAAKIKRPKSEQHTLNILSPEQVAKMIESCPAHTDTGERNRAIILLLYDTGLRASELCSLVVSDVDLRSRELTVMGKGKKQRMVAISEKTRAQLWRYLTHHRPDKSGDDHLFITRFGTPLEYTVLHRLVSTAGKRAGITGVRCSPHTLRHAFSTQMAPLIDVYDLMMLLGHANIQTTARYVHPHPKQVIERQRKKALGDKLNVKLR